MLDLWFILVTFCGLSCTPLDSTINENGFTISSALRNKSDAAEEAGRMNKHIASLSDDNYSKKQHYWILHDGQVYSVEPEDKPTYKLKELGLSK